MKIALCILTLNESECLKLNIDDIQTAFLNSKIDFLYAIDGGSTDGTIEIFKSRSIDTLHQTQSGRGEAFKLAFANIDADAFIFFSPDGNEDLADLIHIKNKIIDGFDLVIASRMLAGSVNEEDSLTFKPRKWTNLGFNYIANKLFNKRSYFVTDSINGYRAITKIAATKLNLTASDYTIEYQMTIQAFKKQLQISEIVTHERPRLAGSSQVRSLPAGLRFLKRLLLEIIF